MEINEIQNYAASALPIIFAITVHEAAHGYVAKYFGDLTAYHQNRISLNPARHIDPVGTILLPAVLAILHAPILFGWAKPVPVNPMNLRRPKKDMLWVAAAGPFSNLIMAIFWTILYGRSAYFPEPMPLFVQQMGVAGISINLSLMALNLIPLLPLDGGRITHSLLPDKLAYKYAQVEKYGFLILILLLVTHVLDLIIYPIMQFTQTLIVWLFA
jgi:Zn-dependent protease